MDIPLNTKITAFCRQLGDSTLHDLARDHDAVSEFQRALVAIQAGQIGPHLEADLDALDAMVAQAMEGQGLYPITIRSFGPLPGTSGGTGAQWWTCPQHKCDGRGRVQPGQDPPVCGATGEQLVPRPLPE